MSRGEKLPRTQTPAPAPLTRRPLQLQRNAEHGSPSAHAPDSVQQVLSTPGKPLDLETRAVMEPHFRHDFGKVKVHTDAAAAESARASRASAYTVGSHVVFGEGQYAPQSTHGRRLLAHELTHVVQQSHAPQGASGAALRVADADDGAEREAEGASSLAGAATVAPGGVSGLLQRSPDPEWGKDYKDHKSFLQKSYDEYEKGLGELRPSTKGGISENKGRPLKVAPGSATPAAPSISLDVLKEIFPLLKADLDAKVVPEQQVKDYLASLNEAFKMMKIDSVEGQAYYLAHAYIESQQFRLMTEVGEKNPAHWQKDPKTPDSPAALKYYNDTYAKGGDVNPSGKGEFIGRGPVQVTHRPEYVEAIALIERVGADYQKLADKGDKEAAKFADLAKRAVKAIKKDPQQAANPEFAFLFSAAFVKGKGADVSGVNKTPGGAWTGRDSVGGGDFVKDSPQDKALKKKAAAYEAIYCVLMREAKNAGVREAEAKYAKHCQGSAKAPQKGSATSY